MVGFVYILAFANVSAVAFFGNVLLRRLGQDGKNYVKIGLRQAKVAVFQIHHPIHNVRLAQIDIAYALIHGVGQYKSIYNKEVSLPVAVVLKAFPSVQREPQRHAFAVYLIRAHSVRSAQQPAYLRAEICVIHRVVAPGYGIAKLLQVFFKRAHLHALSSAVYAFYCDYLCFAHMPSPPRFSPLYSITFVLFRKVALTLHLSQMIQIHRRHHSAQNNIIYFAIRC